MAGNLLPTSIDVDQLVSKIRDQISRRIGQDAPDPQPDQFIPPDLLQKIRSIQHEAQALDTAVQGGEPQTGSGGLREKFGSSIKRRLYRWIWWQSYQLKTVVGLFDRLVHIQAELVERLAKGGEPYSALSKCQRQIDRNEDRLNRIESAQLRLQATEIERNVRESVLNSHAPEIANLARDLSEVKSSLAQSAKADDLAIRLEVETAKRVASEKEFALRLDAVLAKSAASEKDLVLRLDAESARNQQLASLLSQLGLYTHQTRASLSLQDRRIDRFILEARKRLPEPLGSDQIHKMGDDHSRHRFDSLYAAFEDVFRGSREEIKTRQAVYLPLLHDAGIGSSEMPLLDLGCGRGEWIELLKENGLAASGLDLNDEMIERCKSLSLSVAKGDALSHLGGLPDSSLGAITAFHLVEHMPFELVIQLVDESLRVLKSGGILILETPNPANLLVGAHTFYLDPTHLKPLPSPMLRFFVEGRGFCDVHVRELHPYPDVVRLPDEGSGVGSRLNDCIYGPQDYAVIGRKP